MEELLKKVKEHTKKGEIKESDALFLELLKKDSNNFEALYEYASYLLRTRRVDGAVRVLEKAFSVNPEHKGVLNNLGVLYKKRGQIGASEKLFKRAIAVDKEYVEVYNNLANLYRENGMHKDAFTVAKKALEIDNKNISILINLSLTLQKMREYKEALKCLDYALKLEPDRSNTHLNVGNIFYEIKRFDLAQKHLEKAIELDPKVVDYYNNLGVMLKSQEKYKEAVEVYQKGLELFPNHGNIYNNMSLALKELREFEEAEEAAQKAIELNKNDANAYNNLGTIYEDLYRFEEARENFTKAVIINPEHINANWNLSVLTLNMGDLKEGFSRYHWRWKSEGAKPKPKLSSKEWKGDDLEGKKIFIYSEQGFGDSIHFVRYLKLLKEKGAYIIYQCKKELEPLMKNLRTIDEVIMEKEDIQCDYNAPLLDLPHILGTDLETIPNEVPYLFTKGRKVSIKRLNRGVNIGLVWSGSPTHKNHKERFIDLKLFEPILKLPDVRVFSLQVGEDKEQIKEYGLESKIIDLSSKLTDFTKTASVISQLDLVIGSDTSVVHLAGALGVKCYTMLPLSNDWRWMQKREDSPWYPSMKLFRQKEFMEWNSVIDEVKEEIVTNRKKLTAKKNSKRK